VTILSATFLSRLASFYPLPGKPRKESGSAIRQIKAERPGVRGQEPEAKGSASARGP
jgi:hypothetical protein